MKKFKKQFLLLLTAVAVLAISLITAQAATRGKVGKINLNIYNDISVGDSSGNPSASTDNSYCYVESVEILNYPEKGWTRSQTPTLEITLCTYDEDYYFNSTSSGNFKLTVNGPGSYDGADFKSAARSDDQNTLTLTVRLTYGDVSAKPEEPDSVYWDGETGRVVWEEAPNASHYQLQLLRDGSPEGPVVTTSSYYYNFGTRMYQPGNYRVRIRTIEYGAMDHSDWVETSTKYLSPEKAAAIGAASGTWQKGADGVKTWWRYNDGSWPSSEWIFVDNCWYYADSSGYNHTGWLELNQVYYYMDDTTGRMLTSQETPDHYWVNENGIWVP